MNLILSKNIIIGYASGSAHYPGSVDVPDDELPDGFFDDFGVGMWLYDGSEIVKNPDFVPPPPPAPSLEEQVVALTEQNQMLTDCILEMSEIIYGGD